MTNYISLLFNQRRIVLSSSFLCFWKEPQPNSSSNLVAVPWTACAQYVCLCIFVWEVVKSNIPHFHLLPQKNVRCYTDSKMHILHAVSGHNDMCTMLSFVTCFSGPPSSTRETQIPRIGSCFLILKECNHMRITCRCKAIGNQHCWKCTLTAKPSISFHSFLSYI